MKNSFSPGQRVTYWRAPKNEIGIVKSVSDEQHVFVVYHCDDDWDRYEEYTATRTNIDDLTAGWIL